jgi:hypothetical protein
MFYPSSLYHHCRIFASPAWTNEEICVITTHFITAYLLNTKESRSALIGKFILPRTSGQARQAAVLSAQPSTTAPEAQAAPSTSASTSKEKASKSAVGPTAITTDQPATSSAPSSEQGKQGKAAKQKAPEQETAEQPKKVEILRSPEILTPR